MIEGIISKSRVPMKGQILGYTGECKMHVAALNIEGDKVLGCEFLKFFSPHQTVAFFLERPKPLGIGLLETLAWGAGKEGWRAADYWIDEAPFHQKSQYDEFPFYYGPFQEFYSCRGLALLSLLRRRWPDLAATETRPGECYSSLVKSIEWPARKERIATLGHWLKFDLPAELDERDWQAAMSAYAMWMGLRGDWPIDLHRLTSPGTTRWQWEFPVDGKSTEETFCEPAMSYEALIFPAGPVSFFWPPDERKTAERS